MDDVSILLLQSMWASEWSSSSKSDRWTSWLFNVQDYQTWVAMKRMGITECECMISPAGLAKGNPNFMAAQRTHFYDYGPPLSQRFTPVVPRHYYRQAHDWAQVWPSILCIQCHSILHSGKGQGQTYKQYDGMGGQFMGAARTLEN